MYHFPVSPRNDVRMFKLRYESATSWIWKHRAPIRVLHWYSYERHKQMC